MQKDVAYGVAADIVLLTHVLFVAFVVCGLACVLVAKPLGWSWVRNPWFRLAHLLCIGFVVVQSWLGAMCPLTVWEMGLRDKAGDVVYQGDFIAHWLESILYYRAPAWVFAVCYTVFGVLVLASWFWVRPRSIASDRYQAAPADE